MRPTRQHQLAAPNGPKGSGRSTEGSDVPQPPLGHSYLLSISLPRRARCQQSLDGFNMIEANAKVVRQVAGCYLFIVIGAQNQPSECFTDFSNRTLGRK